MQDHYETLQVHPKADGEAIVSAYERLRQRYDPALLVGAADELIELARQRRDAIERAYVVLSDPERRASYDAALAEQRDTPSAAEADAVLLDDDELIDYRPLPPARRQERPKGFDAQPRISRSQAARNAGRRVRQASSLPIWVPPVLIVAIATFGIVLVTLISTATAPPPQAAQTPGPNSIPPSGAAAQAPAAQATPTLDQLINQFEGQVIAARQVAKDAPDNPNAWIELGNALYDSTVVVRERMSSDQRLQSVYIERLPRWIEASAAYEKALTLQPGDPVVRSDLAASLCYYGADANDQSYVARGLSEAELVSQKNPAESRALLSFGLCLASTDPPQTQRALEQWQRVIVLPDVEPGIALQARALIAEYSR